MVRNWVLPSRLKPTLVTTTLFTLASCSASDNGTGADTPPSEPTHHAAVQGSVVDGGGQGLEGVGVGPRFAQSSPSDRQVSVMGRAYTDSAGAYRFTVQALTPDRADGLADFYVYATLYAPPGGLARVDSVLVTVRFVPLGRTPNLVRVPPLRLLAR